MNRIYRVVWNASLGVFVAVSELATARGKSSSTTNNAASSADKKAGIFKPVKTALALSMLFALPHSVMAAENVDANNLTVAGTSTFTGAATFNGGITANSITVGGKAVATSDQITNLETNKADKTAVDALSNQKADKTTVDALSNQKADKTAVDALSNQKADKTAVDALEANKADKTAVDALSNRVTTLGLTDEYSGIKYFRVKSTDDDAKAKATDSVAVGPKAYTETSATKGIAIGNAAQAGSKTSGEVTYDGAGSFMIGDGESSLAIGDSAAARGNQNIAIGKSALTTNKDAAGQLSSNNIAIGTETKTIAASNAIALGNQAVAGAKGAVADSAIAIGDNAKALAADATAVGHLAQAGNFGLAAGTNAQATGSASVALGQNAKSTSQSSIAIGKDAEALPFRTISIGQDAGKNQAADKVGDKNEHINIGVQAGENIDGQLNISIGQKAGSDTKGKGNIALGQNAGQFVGGINSSVGNNIAIGTNANRFSVPNDVQEVIAIGFGATAEGTRSVALGKDAKTKKVDAVDSVAIGASSQANGASSVAIGLNAIVNGADNVALGAKSVADTKAGTGYLTGKPSSTVVSVGNDQLQRRIVNVADGADDQDAVTVAQLKRTSDDVFSKVNTQLNNLPAASSGINYDTAPRNPETNSITLSKDGKNTIIGNVAPGVLDTDAVNVKQLNQVVEANKIRYFSTKVNGATRGNVNNDGAEGDISLAIGMDVRSTGDRSVTVGNASTAESKGGIAIGALYDGSEALDDKVAQNAIQTVAKSSNGQPFNYNMAIGAGAASEGNNSIAIGSLAKTTTKQQQNTSPDRAIAIGYFAAASDVKANAIGDRATSSAEKANAFGSQAFSSGVSSTAIGTVAEASGENSIAMGTHQRVTGANSGSIGYAGEFTPIDIGRDSNGTYAPNATQVSGTGTYSVGNTNSKVTSNESGIFGNDNFVQAKENVRVVGNKNTVTNQGSAANSPNAITPTLKDVYINGHNNQVDVAATPMANSKNLFIMGAANKIGTEGALTITDSYVIGTNNTINTSNTASASDDPSNPGTKVGKGYFILGNNVKATKENSVYLGTDAAYTAKSASTDGDAAVTEPVTVGGTLTYGGFAGTTPVGVVTVGDVGKERRIQNVAAGLISATSTDAINGSQLYATNDKLGNVANTVVENFGGNATLNPDGSITYTNIGNTGQNNIHDAIQAATTKVEGDKGVSVTPKTNADGSTTYTVAAKTDGTTVKVDDNGNIAAVTTGLTNTGTGTVATPTAPNALATAGDIANAINNAGFNLQANGDTKSLVKTGDTVQFLDGDNIKITRAGNDITVATAKNVTFDSVTAGPVVINSTGINAGNTQIKGVKAGTAGTDAVNVDQLTKAQAAATTKVAGDKGVTVSPSTNPDGSTTYTVAAKTDGVTTQVDSNGNIAAVTTGLTNTGTGTVATPTAPNALATAGDIANAINNAGFNLQANGDTKSLVKTGDTVQFLDGDNIKITRAGNDITVATAKNVTFDSVTAGPVVINSTGINAGNTQIKGVKAGTAGTDAVNVDQLTKAQAAATTKVAGDKGVTVSPSTNPDGSTTYTVAAKTDGVTTQVDSNGNIAAVTTGLTNTGTGTVATPTAPNALATAGDIANAINNAGFNLQANGDTKSLVKTGDTVQFLDGDNIKITRAGNDITVATAKNVTFDSVTAGPVVINSTGINAGNTQIKDVKAGTAGTDAVNVDQLTKAQAAATTKVAGDKGVTVSPSTNPDGSTTYTVAAKTDGVTTQVDSNGNIAAVTTGLTNTGTGTVATPTAPNALATAGDIANAINNAGFNLQANGDTKSLVKTGDTVQFLDGDNIKITRAGNDITVATAKNVTFDSVTAGPVVINSTGINAGNTQIKGVKAGTAGTDAVNVDQLTKAQAAATTKVAGDKGVTVSPSTNPDGSTTYTVAAKTDGVTTQVDSNGNIAAVTTGLTNTGTGTVATPTAPNALATAGDIANAINNAGFNLQANGDTKSLVKTGDTVQFLDGDNIKITRAGNDITVATAKNVTFDSVTAGPVVINSTGINAGNTQIKDVKAGTAGTDAVNVDQLTKAQAAATTKVAGDKGVTVSPSTNPDGSTTYTVAAKTDGVTTQVDSNGNIAAVTTGLTNTGTGTVATPTAPNALATAGDIANAINNAGFNLQANGDTKSLVKTGDTVQFLDGDNIKITRAGNDITVATAKNVTFDSVTAGPVVINSTGINAGNTQIKGVKAGTAGTDAVNVDQLTKAQAAATTKVAGDKGVTVSPSTNPDGSTTYTVAAKTDGVTTQVDSNGNIAAVTTGLTNTGTGTVATPTAPNALATAGDIANAINNAGFNLQANGDTKSLVKTGDTVQFLDGDNIKITRAGNDITVATAKNVTFDSVTAGPVVINSTGINAGNTQIKDVKAGTAGTDAVNVDQLTKAQAAATTKVAGDKGVTVSPSTNPDGSTTYTVAAKTDGVTTQVDSNGNIAAVTTTFTPSTDGKVGAPVGNGDSLVTANTVADAINNSGWKATSGATGSGVVDGTTEELINPSETVTFRAGDNMVLNQAENVFTYSLNKDININSVQFNNGPKITNDGNNIKIGDKDGNATKITNVAAGTGDNDAVNVSQLKAVEATANKGWNLTTNGKADSKSNVKPGDTVDFANTDGNVKIENKGNNVIVNLNKDIDLTKDGSVTIGDTKVNNDGLTIAGGPSVTKSGIDAGDKKITNVAPGKISADSKDAINGSQLYTVQQAAVAAKTEVKAGDNVEVKKESGGNGQDIYTVSAKDTSASVTAGSDAITVNKADPKKVVTVDVTDYKVDLSQATKDNIQKGVDAKGIVDNKGLTFAGDNNSSTEVQKLGSTVNVNGDSNITTQASGNTVKVTLNPNVTVESLTATNSVNVGSGNAQVALTTNVGKDDVRELSVGSANAPTRITNVARGVNDTDAVNLSQLKDLGYNINTKIDKVEKEANAGIASAMAMETAPFIAGKWTYAVGAAYHGGEQAVGATLRKTADNGRWSLTGGVATGTEGDPSVRIGISGVID